jgi:hypothetical protein
MNIQDAKSLNLAACIFVFGNINMEIAITTFGTSDMVPPTRRPNREKVM